MGVRGLKRVAEQLVKFDCGGYDYTLPKVPYNLAVDGSMWIVPCLKAQDLSTFRESLRRHVLFQLHRFDSLFRCAAHVLIAVDKHAPPMKRETQHMRMTNRKRGTHEEMVVTRNWKSTTTNRVLRMSEVRASSENVFRRLLYDVCGVDEKRVSFCTEAQGEGECKCVQFIFPRSSLLRVLLTNDSDVITMQMRTCGQGQGVLAYLVGPYNLGGVRVLSDTWCEQPNHRWQVILAALILFGNDYVDPLAIPSAELRHKAFLSIYGRILNGDFGPVELSRESFVAFVLWCVEILNANTDDCECRDSHADNTKNWILRLYWALLYAIEAPTNYNGETVFASDQQIAVYSYAPRAKACADLLSRSSEFSLLDELNNSAALCRT